MITRTRTIPGIWVLVLFAVAAAPRVGHAQSGVVEYYHLDAVGSVRAVTDADGNLLRLHDFKPFGEEVNVTFPNPDRKLFTGQERDQETALDYFGARYYRPDLGRFTSADDSSFLDPYQSGSANLYAHAFGNPLRWVDPTGHEPSCGPFGTDYCEDVYAPMPPGSGLAPMAPNQDPGLMRFLWESFSRNFYGFLDLITMATPVQAPGLGEANLPLVDRSPDTPVLLAATVVRPGRTLTPAAWKAARNLGPWLKMTVREAVRDRGGIASTVNKAGYMADWTVERVAEAYAHGSGQVKELADTALKMVKQAAKKAQKYGGQ